MGLGASDCFSPRNGPSHLLAYSPTSEKDSGARPAADSGYPPDGLTSLGGPVCVGVGRGDIWVVGALGGGLWS